MGQRSFFSVPQIPLPPILPCSGFTMGRSRPSYASSAQPCLRSARGRTFPANAEALEEAQQVLDLQEAGLLPALYVLDPPRQRDSAPVHSARNARRRWWSRSSRRRLVHRAILLTSANRVPVYAFKQVSCTGYCSLSLAVLVLQTVSYPTAYRTGVEKSVKKALPAIPNKRELATLRNAGSLHESRFARGLPRCDELAMIWPVLKEGAPQSSHR